jgi:hypothetical protein
MSKTGRGAAPLAAAHIFLFVRFYTSPWVIGQLRPPSLHGWRFSLFCLVFPVKTVNTS